MLKVIILPQKSVLLQTIYTAGQTGGERQGVQYYPPGNQKAIKLQDQSQFLNTVPKYGTSSIA